MLAIVYAFEIYKQHVSVRIIPDTGIFIIHYLYIYETFYISLKTHYLVVMMA